MKNFRIEGNYGLYKRVNILKSLLHFELLFND